MQTLKKLSILIPVFNEAATVQVLLDRVTAVQLTNGIEKELIVINDCSTDTTDAVIGAFMETHPELGIVYITHERNLGKGAAIHSGIAKASGDYLIIQDADLEYDPEEINVLLQPVIKGQADVVYGSRFMGGNSHRILFFWHYAGNKLLTTLSNMFTNLNLSDMETCYKLFRTALLKNISLKEKRFGFEPEITAKVSRIPNVRIYEVGISYYGRTYEEGKKIHWKDGFRAIYCILKYNIFSK